MTNNSAIMQIAEIIDYDAFHGIGATMEGRKSAENRANKVWELICQSPLNTQHGGDHYKKLGDYQPWLVLKNWLTPKEFRGYMKGTAIAYLAREKDKGGDLDIEKAIHTLQALLELEK